MMRLVFLQEEEEYFFVLLYEDTMTATHLQARTWCWHPDLGLWASRPWENHYYLSYLVCGTFLWQPELRHIGNFFFFAKKSEKRSSKTHSKSLVGCRWGWRGKLNLDLMGEPLIILRISKQVPRKTASVMYKSCGGHPRMMEGTCGMWTWSKD